MSLQITNLNVKPKLSANYGSVKSKLLKLKKGCLAEATYIHLNRQKQRWYEILNAYQKYKYAVNAAILCKAKVI
ncbi:MAG: hypothetical protein ACQEWD_02930 [Bacteroidota bacterium]|uniref:Uncharacterized protein n=1 Tax=Salegentibacter flavus TaxID=287099 RepID=A0A1I5C8W6_9FLAO|nr:hypothetical protein [Salegentibacter flavus]SFN83475.1 hypothetical protein SAMN05660413_02760 [Salegentibacter flavus]